MPIPALVIVSIAVVGSVAFLAHQVKSLRRQRRNLRHWERGEPLEGVSDWD